MGPKVIVYDEGNVYEIDSDDIYDPFPEPKEEDEEEESQELQRL